MDASTPLWKAHDLSQELQDRIEVLPNVERAFVHVDHETDHAPVRYPLFCHVCGGVHAVSAGASQIHLKKLLTLEGISHAMDRMTCTKDEYG